MTQKIYIVEGRQFRTEADYQNALKDQQVIENLRMQTKKMNLSDQKKLLEVIRSGNADFTVSWDRIIWRSWQKKSADRNEKMPRFLKPMQRKKGIFKEASKEKRNTET